MAARTDLLILLSPPPHTEPTQTVYYKLLSNAADTTKITGFPEGMKMLAGNPYVRF